MSTFADLSVAARQQILVDALQFLDPVIADRQHAKVSVYRSLIPRAPFVLGEGLVKDAYRFYPGIGDQRGLQKWSPIQISQVGTGSVPGYDACQYNPYTLQHGYGKISYSGLQTSRKTPPICVRDIRFLWQMKQQVNSIFSYLGDVTNDIWENYGQEMSLKFANDAGRAYVLSNGSPSSTQFTYDPLTVDADGDNLLTFDATKEVSTLDWSYLRWFSRYLQLQCPQAAIGMTNGRPQFGLVFDLEDWDTMLQRDAALREDFRYANPDILIDNYGLVTSYKGFSLMHNMLQPRFTTKKCTSSVHTLKRLDPYVETAASAGGVRYDLNPDYLNAEYAIAHIFLNDVFQIEVPPAGPVSPGGGTSFGATPSLNGEFTFVNIPDLDTNILSENGSYFGRFEGFAKPLKYDEEATMLLYRRCPQSKPQVCEICGDNAASADTHVGLAADAAETDLDTTNYTIALTLSQCLGCETGAPITLVADNSSSNTGVIADASAAPTYVFALTAASQANTQYTAAGSSYVVCA